MNNHYIRRWYFWLLWQYMPVVTMAQISPNLNQPTFRCEVTAFTPAQRKILETKDGTAFQGKKRARRAANITYVPIRPHILRASNGTGGMTLAQLNDVLALTNRYFLNNGSGMQFYFCGTLPDYIDNDAWYTNYTRNDENAIAGPRDATDALNMYFPYGGEVDGLFGGYSYYPGDYLVSTRLFISGKGRADILGNKIVPHELGHTFNLLHTHGSGSRSLELVTRGAGANCTTEGDLLCDTPADSYGQFQNTDANGDTYTPPVYNIMAVYSYDGRSDNFTPQQYARMNAALTLRQSHTAYSLTCLPTPVNAPTSLAASMTTRGLVLTWTDNADNEMGYFIERSTSPTEGFVPIAGVAPNVTTFTDTTYPGYTTLYYRIRPSNSTTEGVGSMVRIVSSFPQPCNAVFSQGSCSFGYGMNGVTFNNVVLSENTGCSPTANSLYDAVTHSVMPGQTYAISGTFLSSSTNYAQKVAIWIDANRNGLYTDEGERLFQTLNSMTGGFATTLTIPASVVAGPLRMRVLSSSSYYPVNDPCGIRGGYGEAEDYILNVVVMENCTAMYTVKNGDWTDPTVWSCNRLPVVNDTVVVNHVVTIPMSMAGQVSRIQYANEGHIILANGASLRID